MRGIATGLDWGGGIRLWVSWMFSAITLVLYICAQIRFDMDAAFGSSFNILAALLVEETLIRSTPFKFLSNHISHCPKASSQFSPVGNLDTEEQRSTHTGTKLK